jgi:hypothetical protein
MSITHLHLSCWGTCSGVLTLPGGLCCAEMLQGWAVLLQGSLHCKFLAEKVRASGEFLLFSFVYPSFLLLFAECLYCSP